MKHRQWLPARRPDGAIRDSDFKLVETGRGESLLLWAKVAA